jgi:phosphatidylserine/phosphatidylglycerophosphate/cardiolipin synthase-like enzyme
VPPAEDPTLAYWFLSREERGNPSTDIAVHTTGNLVTALVHGSTYFRELFAEIEALTDGEEIYLASFRTDGEELLDGPGTAITDVLVNAVGRGVHLAGLIWRSQPEMLEQSERANADVVRSLRDAGASVLLDARTRRGGSHHQKLVVLRGPGRDVAFLGGIDLALSRNDDASHLGDPQVMPFTSEYGERPPWHDVQVSVRGPAVNDVELTFRERWYGGTTLDRPSPIRMAFDRARHAGDEVPELPPARPQPAAAGPHAVQILRTYPARWRRYPFAPTGERSIAHAYRKVLRRARSLIYVEDQYLWAPAVAELLSQALISSPELRLIVVVPRFPDKEGVARIPSLVGRARAIDLCRLAGSDRFAIYDVENVEGTPVYVHAKVVVVDDVWAMVGSDNMNRRSWTHDSELSCAVLDSTHDPREPVDPAGLGDGSRTFARQLRLELWHEHLDRDSDSDEGLLSPADAFDVMAASAQALQAWHDGGKVGPRPPGRLRPHAPETVPRRHRSWALPVSRAVYDPDGSGLRDRLRRRL